MLTKQKTWTRQRVRSALILITFLLFPVVMNFLSPFVIINGAFRVIITESFILFCALFISLFFGQLWCGWVCPAAGLQEACFAANDRQVRGKRPDWIKWVIWALRLGVIVLGFISAGGVNLTALRLTAEINKLYQL